MCTLFKTNNSVYFFLFVSLNESILASCFSMQTAGNSVLQLKPYDIIDNHVPQAQAVYS